MKNWMDRLAEWWKNTIGNKSAKSAPADEDQVDLDKLFKSKKYLDSIEKLKNPEKPDIDKMIAEGNPNITVDVGLYLNEICSYGKDLSKLNDSQRYLYLSQTVYNEVNNGGFAQYFANSSGDYVHESVEALIRIGDQKTAHLLQKAIDKFPSAVVPKDYNKRNALFNILTKKIGDALHELDDAFYRHEETTSDITLEFIKKKIFDFRFN